jgi:hypothetical protein
MNVFLVLFFDVNGYIVSDISICFISSMKQRFNMKESKINLVPV